MIAESVAHNATRDQETAAASAREKPYIAKTLLPAEFPDRRNVAYGCQPFTRPLPRPFDPMRSVSKLRRWAHLSSFPRLLSLAADARQFQAAMRRFHGAHRRVVCPQHLAAPLESPHQRAPIFDTRGRLIGHGRVICHCVISSQSRSAGGWASDDGSGSRKKRTRSSLVSLRGTMQRA